MVAGRSYWIAIWCGILLIGLLGLLSSLYWGRQTRWKNLDELLRAIGTITVSTGMLLLLNAGATAFGQVLLFLSLICFIVAFVLGRKVVPPADTEAGDDLDEPPPGAGA